MFNFRDSRICRHGVVITLLSIHAAALAWAATCHSPTYDEPAHVVAGISNWKHARYELYRVNPPLTRMIAAAPLMLLDYEEDWSAFFDSVGARPVFALGSEFVRANGTYFQRLLTVARWACIPISLLGGLVAYVWARDLYGHAGGLISLVLWCFSPNLLTHAELVTPDAAAATFGLLAGYSFWKWLKQPGFVRALAAGACLGLAELSKMSWVILFGVWPAVWIAWKLWSDRQSEMTSTSWRSSALQFCVIMGMALHVLNAGYRYDGTFTRLGDYRFISSVLAGGKAPPEGANRFQGTALAGLPVPLPKQYVIGMDIQKHDLETSDKPSYLRGTWRQGGWWWYYVYGIWTKVPHGTQILLGLAAAVTAFSGLRRFQDELVLLTPGICLLVLVSCNTTFNHHFRYVLPCLGFLIVLAGKAGSLWLSEHQCVPRPGLFRVGAAAATAFAVFSVATCYPGCHSYFNEAAGGPSNGHAHLQHSCIDWGQDLFSTVEAAEEVLRSRPEAQQVSVLYQGLYSPASLLPGWQEESELTNLEWIDSATLIATPLAMHTPRTISTYALMLERTEDGGISRRCFLLERTTPVPGVLTENEVASARASKYWHIDDRLKPVESLFLRLQRQSDTAKSQRSATFTQAQRASIRRVVQRRRKST